MVIAVLCSDMYRLVYSYLWLLIVGVLHISGGTGERGGIGGDSGGLLTISCTVITLIISRNNIIFVD